MARTAIIVQARMASTRLPGKVMLPLAGEPVIRHVLRRCLMVPSVDAVVCAVSDKPENVPIENEAEMLGVTVYRGSESDVLARYYGAAAAVGADCIMRITSDCPAIDPVICGEVLSLMDREKADYACNNTPRTYPHGLDCEAFTFESLKMCYLRAVLPAEREHVTPWLRENPNLKRVNLACRENGCSENRWTLDRPEDYAFFKTLFAHLTEQVFDWKTVLRTVTFDPELTRMQRACRTGESRDQKRQ